MSTEKPPYVSHTFNSKIFEVLTNESISQILDNIHEEYYYWTKVKHLPLPEGISSTDLWFLVKTKRRITPNRIFIGKYRFNWNTNNRLQEFLHFIDMNVGGTLESSYAISSEDKNRYLVSSIMEEAIASSQIEGAVTSRKAAKEMLRRKIKPRDKSEQMILNNYITIKKILEIKSEPLDKAKLLSLHKLVTSNTMPDASEEGALREGNDINVYDAATGEIVHHPPNKDELDDLLNDLFKFFNEDNESSAFIHPLVKACIIHFLVGFIHPFSDGNGRTARALFYWYLLKKEYWLTEYLSISRMILKAKSQYAKAFVYTEVDDHDLTYFILFNLRIMKLAFEELRHYIQRKNEEKRQLSDFVIMDGISLRQSQILEWFYKEPSLILTVNEVQTRLAVSNGSARSDLKQLVDKQYLSLIHLNQVTKGYIKGEEFDGLLRKIKRTL